MKERLKELAEQAGITFYNIYGYSYRHGTLPYILERFAELIRADERDACLACYSPDDTANDWADKIRSRGDK